MKRFLALVLLVCLVLTTGPADAKSAGGNPESSTAAAPVQPAGENIYLRGLTLQPQAGEPELTPSLTQTTPQEEGFRIVQFSGPVQPEWLEELLVAGLEIVAYLPNYAYVVWGDQPTHRLDRAAALTGAVRWDGAYHPFYRLAPELRSLADGLAENSSGQAAELEFVDVTVQFYNTRLLKESLERITNLADAVHAQPTDLLNLTHVRVRVSTADLAGIAGWPDVFNIEPYVRPEKLDEIQGQLLAGNVNVGGSQIVPSGPGYLAWLESLGFPKTPEAYPLVGFTDDGLDAGQADSIRHADFYALGSLSNPDRVVDITNCTNDPTGNSIGGHGNLNAGILAGYNDQSGFPYRDANGYQYGLGISPYGPIAMTKVFDQFGWFSLNNCGASLSEMVSNAYENGVRITSNSWGAPVNGAYNVDSQVYDFLTRDAALEAGNQEVLHVFAAGNSGPELQSLNSPGTAKNVLTVGATESVRDHQIMDGCFLGEANSAGDVASFSSRGPTVDGRVKPDILAPGTHIIGPASQDDGYNATGICGGVPGADGFTRYYPEGQTLYTWSSGTSHSAPAVSGAAQLLFNYYERVINPGQTPSPAMLKALLLNTPRFISGTAAGTSLPNSQQGWGSVNLGMAFDETPRILIDQAHVFSASGETFYLTGQVVDPGQPLRVSLVWTDPPAASSAGKTLVNNLDLQVYFNGAIYKGNVFNGQYSTGGGAADSANNVESVFLPTNQEGAFQVQVTAQNLAGDGIPGSGSITDQDFALVVYNGEESDRPVLSAVETRWHEQNGNGNGAIDPGETIGVGIVLSNQGNGNAVDLAGILQTSSPHLTIMTSSSNYENIVPRDEAINSRPFLIKVHEDAPCGMTIPMVLTISHPDYPGGLDAPPLRLGERVIHRYNAAGLPKTIPDFEGMTYTPGILMVPVNVPNPFTTSDLDVHVNIHHTFDEDLILSLLSPQGTEVVLSEQNGGMGDHYLDTIFDDEAVVSIRESLPPYTGRLRPQEALQQFVQQPASGEWQFKVQDLAQSDVGELLNMALVFEEVRCEPYQSTVEMVPGQAGTTPVSAMPGDIVSFLVQIKNRSSQEDSFDLRTGTPFPIQFPETVGPLAPGASEMIEVRVKIPSGLQSTGQVSQIVLTATSRRAPANQAESVLFLIVGQRFWLPSIHR